MDETHALTWEGRRTTGTDTRPVLIVDDNAHSTVGHYAELFADLAVAVRELGQPVAVLTSHGWALEHDPSFGPLDVFDFGPIASASLRVADTLQHLPPKRFFRLLSSIPRSAAIVGAARGRRRRIGGKGVITMGRGVHPLVAAVLADRERWLVYRFDPPAGWLTQTTRPGHARSAISLGRRVVLAATRRAQERRERHGGCFRLVVNSNQALAQWKMVAPWLRPALVPFAICTRGAPMPAARGRLGLASDARLALSFGSPHGGKDLEVVWQAFSKLSDWQLVIAGNGAADAYRAWQARTGNSDRQPILIDGYVDRATRGLLYSAVDLAILSFKPGHVHDSATLTDALSWGVPVVCSSGCPAADIVSEYRLGHLFRAGDVDLLVQAMANAPGSIDDESLATARHRFSASHTAGQLLRLVESAT